MRSVAVAFAAFLFSTPLAAADYAGSVKLPLSACSVPGGSEIVGCGRLEVPENWDRPDGRKISLNIVVMPMVGQGQQQAPVFWLEGGPGIAGTQSAPLYSGDLKFHRQRRAVVLFDQRGTGQSAALHCRDSEHRPVLADMYKLSAVSACRRSLEVRADLGQYTTYAAARDLDAIRVTLGYDKIDLMGLSYGTLLGQAYMKLYPAHVRAAAFISTVPLGEKLPLHHAMNGELALRQVFEDCRNDDACHFAFPQLEGDWFRLMQRLSSTAVSVKSDNGQVVIRSGPFGEAVRSMLNTVAGQRHLPLIVTRAAKGDFQPLLKMLEAQGPDPGADGLYLSVTCPEGTKRIRSDEILRETEHTSFGRYRLDQQISACSVWASARPNAELLTPLRSTIPTLFLAGGRDATAPAAWARAVSSRLPHSRVLVIGAMAHLPVGLAHMVCLDRIMDAFFAQGSAAGLNTSCTASMTPPQFALR